jgi:hypothetical protein
MHRYKCMGFWTQWALYYLTPIGLKADDHMIHGFMILTATLKLTLTTSTCLQQKLFLPFFHIYKTPKTSTISL